IPILTPHSANFRPMPLPMPREPPVIKACFPFSDIALLLLLRGFVQAALSPSDFNFHPRPPNTPVTVPKTPLPIPPVALRHAQTPLRKIPAIAAVLPAPAGNSFP